MKDRFCILCRDLLTDVSDELFDGWRCNRCNRVFCRDETFPPSPVGELPTYPPQTYTLPPIVTTRYGYGEGYNCHRDATRWKYVENWIETYMMQHGGYEKQGYRSPDVIVSPNMPSPTLNKGSEEHGEAETDGTSSTV